MNFHKNNYLLKVETLILTQKSRITEGLIVYLNKLLLTCKDSLVITPKVLNDEYNDVLLDFGVMTIKGNGSFYLNLSNLQTFIVMSDLGEYNARIERKAKAFNRQRKKMQQNTTPINEGDYFVASEDVLLHLDGYESRRMRLSRSNLKRGYEYSGFRYQLRKGDIVKYARSNDWDKTHFDVDGLRYTYSHKNPKYFCEKNNLVKLG